eukprot:Rhum_TRINITY_DN14998_c0_g1::Rhum_TRINITY_DN14998_c0_g1_i1::g.131338::m.131338
MRAALLLSTLLLLCLQAARCQGASKPIHIDSFDDGYEQAHVALMATSFTLVGVAVIGVIVSLVITGRVSLVSILVAMMLSAVVIVGMVSWVITYSTMRDEMQAKVQALIIAAGDSVDVSVLRALESGETIMRMYQRSHDYSVTSLNASFPAPVPVLHAIRRAFVDKDAAVNGMYFGTKWGYTLGTYPERGNASVLNMYMGYPATASVDQLRSFRCLGWDHAAATGCEAVNCTAGGAPAAVCAGTCKIYNVTNCYSRDVGTSRIIYYQNEWGNPYSNELTETTWQYDPHERPWYKLAMAAADGEPIWTEPYVFASQTYGDEELPDIGFSAAVAIPNPTTGEKEGVFAVDYTLGSLHATLVALRPTEHAAILLCSLTGGLYASSTYAGDIAEFTVDADGKRQYTLADGFTHPKAEIREVFHGVRRVVGSLEAAAGMRRLIQLHDSTLLVSPFAMSGLRLLVVIEVPHKDMLDEVNAASTLSLVFVMVISIVLSALLAGVIIVLVLKLKKLSNQMHHVAWMHVESSSATKPDSIIEEIRSMQESFALLVNNMAEYKQYLPQSLVADTEDEKTGDKTDGCVAPLSPASLSSASTEQGTPPRRSPIPSHSSDTSAKNVIHQQLFETGLEERSITALCYNWRGTHARVHAAKKGGSLVHFADSLSKYVESVLQTCKQARGVVDSFSGDRVCVTFNAVVSASQHLRRATDCAVVFPGKVAGGGIVCGVSTSTALCGNMGCSGLKNYSVIGKAMTAAHALVRVASIVNERVVMEEDTVEVVEHCFAVKSLRMVSLPNAEEATLVRSVLSKLSTGAVAEWMYELEEAHKSDPYVDYNAAVHLLHMGSYGEALERLEKSIGLVSENELSSLKKRILVCQTDGQPEPPLLL